MKVNVQKNLHPDVDIMFSLKYIVLLSLKNLIILKESQ